MRNQFGSLTLTPTWLKIGKALVSAKTPTYEELICPYSCDNSTYAVAMLSPLILKEARLNSRIIAKSRFHNDGPIVVIVPIKLRTKKHCSPPYP